MKKKMAKGRMATGKIDAHHVPPHAGKDGHASKEYHAANSKAGMPMGCSHCESGGSGPGGQEAYGGEGMASNAHYS